MIVDDEYAPRQELRHLLTSFPEVEITGEATGADEALRLIRALRYDIVFLDIQMPGLDGMELAARLQRLPDPPLVVFTTAHDEYALQAFDVNAVDYLLKPFDQNRLARALARVKKARATNADRAVETPVMPGLMPGLERLPVQKGDRTVLVKLEDVVFVYAENEDVYVKLTQERLPVRFTMKELEARLSGRLFFRTHRQYLVNLARVRAVVPYFKGALALIVDDAEKSRIPVSRPKVQAVRRLLGLEPEQRRWEKA